MTKEGFDSIYELKCTPKDTTKPTLSKLSFSLANESADEYRFNILGAQFTESLQGTLEVVRYQQLEETPLSRLMQESNQNKILDSEGMEIDLSGLSQDLLFDKDKYESQQKIDNISGTLDKVTGNSFSQILMIGLSMNPLMFGFTANVMQRMVYFRSLRSELPTNLDGFFKITGSGWSIRTGDTDYKNSTETNQKGLLDNMFGLEKQD